MRKVTYAHASASFLMAPNCFKLFRKNFDEKLLDLNLINFGKLRGPRLKVAMILYAQKKNTFILKASS